MAEILRDDLRLCSCCTQVAANADDSACRDYWGHADHALSKLSGYVAVGDSIEESHECGECDGCGENAELVSTAVILS